MKISKLLTALAVAAAVAGFASCSNSSDTSLVPFLLAASDGPSVRITGANVIAANATTSTYVSEPTRTTLYAFPSNFGTDTIKFAWSVEGKEHVEDLSDVYANQVQVTAKNGDTSVDSADQTFKVKVLVQSTTNASKKAEAEYTVKILKKATTDEGKVPLKFIEWKPDFPYVVVNGDVPSARTYKPVTAEVKKPGENAAFDLPEPIYNGYSANTIDATPSSKEYRKGWTYTTSDPAVAEIHDLVNVNPKHSEAAWTDADGDGASYALIVNKTDKESLTLTVAGNYNLSADVKPAFSKTVTYKVAKGKKITVKLNANSADPFKYRGDAVTTGSIVLDDVYAGVDYVTGAITGTVGGDNTAMAKGLIDPAGAIAKQSFEAGKVTFRVKYDTADNSAFDVKWTND